MQCGGFSSVSGEGILLGMDAWNGWYHVNGNTYGTWLPGDARGWREKGHKKHVEGDYKNPPPRGAGDALHRHAESLLKHAPVHLSSAYRQIAGQALVEMLLYQDIEVIALSVGTVHYHALGRFPDKQVRPHVGRAKRHATFVLRDHGHQTRVWTEKCKVTPIADRQHQLNAFDYICRHAKESAWLWTFREGIYWPSTIST